MNWKELLDQSVTVYVVSGYAPGRGRVRTKPCLSQTDAQRAGVELGITGDKHYCTRPALKLEDGRLLVLPEEGPQESWRAPA